MLGQKEKIPLSGSENDFGFSPGRNFLGDSDPTKLSERLSRPRNLDLINSDFDNGEAKTRDVAGFTERQRINMISFGRQANKGNDIDILSSGQHMIKTVVQANQTFQANINRREYPTQPMAGYNFTVNAQGFHDANLPWAKLIDEKVKSILEEATGEPAPRGGLDALIRYGNDEATDNITRKVWTAISNAHPTEMAWYLAERSQYSENWQRERYQNEMVESKQSAGRLISLFSEEYNLPDSYRKRALGQLKRAGFSAFDHVIAGVDAGDGVFGDYQSGSLRVEVKFGGDVSQPGDPPDTLGVLTHELFHASSAQFRNIDDTYNIGLKSGDQGLDANEGMTELLKKLSLDKIDRIGDNFHFYDSHYGQEIAATTYDAQVKSMFILMEGDPATFGILYQTYFGYVPDVPQLEYALNRFNEEMQKF